MIKLLAVYCGARDGSDKKYLEAARQLGEWMAAHRIDLVYGGGQFGLMGAVANGVLIMAEPFTALLLKPLPAVVLLMKKFRISKLFLIWITGKKR